MSTETKAPGKTASASAAPASPESRRYTALQVRAAKLRVALDRDLKRDTPADIQRIADSAA